MYVLYNLQKTLVYDIVRWTNKENFEIEEVQPIEVTKLIKRYAHEVRVPIFMIAEEVRIAEEMKIIPIIVK